MSETDVCKLVSKMFENLAVKITEAYVAKSIDHKVVKEDLKKLRELAEKFSKESGCQVDLSKIDAVLEEVDEDSKELEETKRALGWLS